MAEEVVGHRLRRARQIVALAIVVSWCYVRPTLAVTLLLRLEPGKSTRADADGVLCSPVRVGGQEIAVMIAAQKGDCVNARTLFDTYKRTFGSGGGR